MRKALGYVLVFCFIVIAVPKTVLHHHDHDHFELSDCDSFSQDHEDCFSCDFDYTSLSANVGTSLSGKLVYFEEYLNDRLLDGNSSYSLDFQSRGPPHVDFILSA
jgi:hypothetical protein